MAFVASVICTTTVFAGLLGTVLLAVKSTLTDGDAPCARELKATEKTSDKSRQAALFAPRIYRTGYGAVVFSVVN